MKTCLPNFMPCDSLGLNLGVYGQLDCFIANNMLSIVTEKYPIIKTTIQSENQKKMDMLSKLFFKFSESTNSLYNLTEGTSNLDNFEEMRISPVGKSTVGEVYYSYDIIFAFYDFKEISWLNLPGHTVSGSDADKKMREVYLKTKSNQINGNNDISNLINNFMLDINDTEFIYDHIDATTPMGFYLNNFNNYIGTIQENLIKIRTPENKYKMMFFVNFLSYPLFFINDYMFGAKDLPESLNKENQNQNYLIYNNNYDLDYPESTDSLFGTSLILNPFHQLSTLGSDTWITQSTRFQNYFTRSNNRFIDYVSTKSNWADTMGNKISNWLNTTQDNIRKEIKYLDGYNQNLSEAEAKQRQKINEKRFGKPRTSRRYYLSAKSNVIGVFQFFRDILVDIKTVIKFALKPLIDLIVPNPNIFPKGVQKGQFFRNGARRLASFLSSPFAMAAKAGKKLPSKVASRAGGWIAAAMMGFVVIGIHGLAQSMWDDYCEMANEVFYTQLRAKDLAITMGELVFGGPGGDCTPNPVPPSIKKMNKTDLGITEEEFNCVDADVCMAGGDLEGSCSCKMFRQLQLNKDGLIKFSMYENIVLKEKVEIIKKRNSQFTIVMFTLVILISILLLTKYILSMKSI